MILTLIEKYGKNIKTTCVSFLFSFFIFFWGVSFSYLQLRFSIFLLIIPILINFDKVILQKSIKYFLISLLLFLHLFLQSNFLLFTDIYDLIGLFFLLIIFDIYKKYFFENLDQIISIFILSLFLYIFFSYNSYENYFTSVSDNCLGCFSILREFFNENSHFGMVASTVIFYLIFISRIYPLLKYVMIIFFAVICYMNPSITAAAGFVFLIFNIFFLLFNKAKKTFILAIIICFIILLNKEIWKERNKISHFFVKTSQINLSTEVYMASLFVTKKAILNKPLGYGFNNYHEAHDTFIKDFSAHNKIVLKLNREDASNNFSKIITEFGLFSLFYFYFLIAFFLNKKIDKKIKIFLIIPLFIETFIRGAGYFNGGFLLFFFYAFYLWS